MPLMMTNGVLLMLVWGMVPGPVSLLPLGMLLGTPLLVAMVSWRLEGTPCQVAAAGGLPLGAGAICKGHCMHLAQTDGVQTISQKADI